MGINLHLFAERHVLEGWELAEPMVPNHHRVRAGHERRGIPWELELAREIEDWPLVPADIVNQTQSILTHLLHGDWGASRFASPFETLSHAKGLPHDISPVLHEWFETTGSELLARGQPLPRGHPQLSTMSGWVTLQEVLDYDWDQMVYLTGNVDPDPPSHRPLRKVLEFPLIDVVLRRIAPLDDPEKLRLIWWLG